jgi:membrane-bound metal-dependent hydrolase YbcI (DUF457 family)
MPDWKTHLIFSLLLVVAWVGTFNLLNVQMTAPDVVLLSLIVVFSSLFPDIDMKNSKMRDVFSLAISATVSAAYLFLFPSSWYYAFVYFIILYLILRYIPTKHRGVTHTFKFSILFSSAIAFLYFIFNPTAADVVFWFVIVLSSYALHLLVDKV